MAEEPVIYLMAEGEETTVVIEQRSGSGSGAVWHTWAGDGGGGGDGASGGGGGGVPVVDGSGAVVGYAHPDPDTGTYTYVDPDPVVVDEQGPSTPAPAPTPINVHVIVPDAVSIPIDGRDPIEVGGLPGVAHPDSFDFKPESDTWQKTGCVAVIFGYGSPFLPPIKIKVGVIVGAPRTLRDGRPLHPREAQLDAANAAQAAAMTIVALLDEGAIEPSAVQPRFVGLMGGAIESTGLGYRVNGCHPV